MPGCNTARLPASLGLPPQRPWPLAAGFYEFMVQPFNVRELRERVKAALGIICPPVHFGSKRDASACATDCLLVAIEKQQYFLIR